MSPYIKGLPRVLRFIGIGLLSTVGAFAQCREGSVRLPDLISGADVAFSGVVDRIDRTDVAETATFDVERVWKGDVVRRMTISRPIGRVDAGNAAPITQTTFRYFVVAHRLSRAERQQMALDERQERFGSDQCGTGIQLLWRVESELATIGPGHAPAQDRSGPSRIRPPAKIKDVAATYPPGVSYDIRGIVILEITIAETGKVTDARVLRSIPALDQAAIDCVMQWEYTPTLLDGKPVPVKLTVTVPIGMKALMAPRPLP